MPSTMRLPIPLTDEEKLALGEEMAKVETDVAVVEKQKKEATSGFTTKIKSLRARITELATSLTTGSIEREVDVEERPNYQDGLVEVVRLDTGIVVSTRTMDPAQRQMGLKLTNGTAVSDAPTEEQNAENPEEAEALRDDRLAREREERIAAAVAELGGQIKVEEDALPNNEEEKFIGRLRFRGLEFTFFGATNEEAHAKVVDGIKAFLLEEETSGAAARIDEIAQLAADQAADQAKTEKATLKVPTKGPKPKKAKRISIKSTEGEELNPEPVEETPVPVAAGAPLCAPDCDIEHAHTEERTAF